MTKRMRADQLLVTRGLFESRAKAQAAIEAGHVTADRLPVTKPSQPLSPGAIVTATPAHPYVSRGGVKLDAALDRFRFDPKNRICLDVGASTGGFTDVLLHRGAIRIYAVDVGTRQLHSSLRGRKAIVLLEKTDVRRLDRARIPEPPQLIAVDVSFISLKRVLPAVTALAADRAALIALVKPQFEAGRRSVRKGIVRDPAVHRTVCEDLIAFVATLGWEVLGVIDSPIPGGDGNREFLLGARLAPGRGQATRAKPGAGAIA
jgi:23S rRNA (cytidine1920-2'-O)/16S rRNA (cytidine1409-2'-O)-methyltransferase